MASLPALPAEMKALRYNKPREFEIVKVPLPKLRDDDVLVKVKACGVCGTANIKKRGREERKLTHRCQHIHEGEFIATFPLTPGHETVGIIVAVGPKVTDFQVGDRVAADNSEPCGRCYYCRKGELLMCENWAAHGINLPGGFAEYCAYPQSKVFRLRPESDPSAITDLEATLIEPASCAAHGLDKIRPRLGSSVLMFGAGPTGLMLAQLLLRNGCTSLTLAAPAGPKLDLARELLSSHPPLTTTFVELPRDADAQASALQQLQQANPRGYDIVVEATGNAKLLESGIEFVARGGTLVVYGVYPNAARVIWSPTRIFNDEIRIIGSFSQLYMFPQTIDYLESGLVKTQGIVNKVFRLEEYGEALESIRNKTAIKAAIVFDD